MAPDARGFRTRYPGPIQAPGCDPVLEIAEAMNWLATPVCHSLPLVSHVPTAASPEKHFREHWGGRQWSSFADIVFPTAASPRPLDEYIASMETLQLDSEPVLESVSYYRYLAPFGHALLLCRLRHPVYGPIALFLQRWADGCNMAPASPDSSSEEAVTAIRTASADADLIRKPHLLCRTMTFNPENSESQSQSPPTLYDLLALADVVRVQRPRPIRSTTSPASSSQKQSTLGLNACSALPLLMAVSNDYKDEINEIVSAFPEGRREFGERIETHRRRKLRWEEALKIAAGVRSPPRAHRAWARARVPSTEFSPTSLRIRVIPESLAEHVDNHELPRRPTRMRSWEYSLCRMRGSINLRGSWVRARASVNVDYKYQIETAVPEVLTPGRTSGRAARKESKVA
ncbi:hypothetical protein DFH08DRAFT_944612 [Mycena albidolilacea]|uniref:Uncharacterized protein n=1 Tax=Mycena albidolilacea TaxID=1033008 RepID=A0AAD7EAZ7_9AGAR|nr:hypothetical protein DFH08DRAFT_944612 [Mycena albidolilacea]